MWIRSQDKKILVNIKEFMIEKFINDLESCVIETDNYSGYHSLRKVVNNVVFQMPQDESLEV